MPFNPGNQNRSGEIFAQYLSQAADNTADAIQRYKNLHQLSKAAEATAAVNPEMLQALGVSAEKFKTLSARDKVSAVQGFMEGQGVKRAIAEGKVADISGRQAQGTDRLMQNLMSGAKDPTQGVTDVSPEGFSTLAGARFRSLINDPKNADQPNGGFSSSRLIQLSTKAGLPPTAGLDFARENYYSSRADAYDAQTNKGETPTQLDTFTLPDGRKAVSVRGSKQLQILSDPDAPVKPQPVLDDQGNPTGQQILPHANGKGFTILGKDNVEAAKQFQLNTYSEMNKVDQQLGKLDPKTDADEYNDLLARKQALKGLLASPTAGGFAGGATGGGGGGGGMDPMALFQQAQDAISKGADPAAVKARLAQRLQGGSAGPGASAPGAPGSPAPLPLPGAMPVGGQ